MSRILCVDDEPAILRLLEVVLRRDGHEVLQAASAAEALAHVGRELVDAVILDLTLPDRDGLELIPILRAGSPAPILVVSARGAVAEKVVALDLGAADFITKPFDGDELRARLRSALRQSGAAAGLDGRIRHGDLLLHTTEHWLEQSGRRVALTPKEFAVLRTLMEAGGRIVTHAVILERVWGRAHREDIEYLRVVVRSLRQKLEADPGRPVLIRNEPAIGYRLT
ncbi:MAG: hypothetical protein RL588_1598 [Pseudomonadota bacterium]|jgi:two-component system KDP operon response regulator KdpE